MFNMNNSRAVLSFEPSSNEYLMDACFSPFRPTVFAAIGTKGKPYIYDLTVYKQVPAYILEESEEEVKIGKHTGGVKICFNPKQRDFLAVGYMDGDTKIYKLNYSLSNQKKNEINILNELIEEK